MTDAMKLTGDGLKAALANLLAPQLEILSGKIEVAGELNGISIAASPDGIEGISVQSNDPRAESLVAKVLQDEVRR